MTKTSGKKEKLGTLSLLSIGIGGMIGGGIFAVTGLTIELTRGGAPIAFVAAGIVALLTAYSYIKLTIYFPSAGGTVEFLNRAYGSGIFTGAVNILLTLSYVILIAVYAYAFGSYGAEWIGGGQFTMHILATSILLLLGFLNFIGPHIVIKSENAFNLTKMLLLGIFIIAGFILTPDWHRMAPKLWVGPVALFSGAMIIFLNYEGFELIANAAKDARNLKKSMPIAYIGGVIIVMLVYILIAIVVVGHLSFIRIAANSDSVLSMAANVMLGNTGKWLIIIAALIATSSAINVTFYGSGRITYMIAKYGELPKEFEHNIRNQPLEGLIMFVIFSVIIVNFVPLQAIAGMGSSGFLLVFLAVNWAAFRLSGKTGASRILTFTGSLACAISFIALILQSLSNPSTAWQIFILIGMIAFSFLVEIVYRKLSGRIMHLGHILENELKDIESVLPQKK